MATDASLDTLRAMVGAASTRDDALLSQALDVAGAHVQRQVYPEHWNYPEVQQAVLMLANRIYKRRQSPEGTAGFAADGLVVRIMANDPDVRALLDRHIDMTRIGIG